MSTTVTYKDSTLTTVNNQTRVLNTAGRWLEGDITLTDVSASSPTLITKSITVNGTYNASSDSVDGFSSVVVNVSGGGTPSATAHTIYFEFTDNTNATITGYWDNSFISDAIRATTPSTYDSKTVTLAQLDNVTWYSYNPSAETWETIYTGTNFPIAEDPYPYFWLGDLSDVSIEDGSVWRITIDGTEYRLTAADTGGMYGVAIGNPKYFSETDNGSAVPFCWANPGWGAWMGGTELSVSDHTIKIERLVTS